MLRSLIVNLVAAFITDKSRRGEFRKRYKQKTEPLVCWKDEKLYERAFRVLVVLGFKINFEELLIINKTNINKIFYKAIHPFVKHETVCYTCITGNYASLHNHCFTNPKWDYVCFTDSQNLVHKRKMGIWVIKPLVFDKLDNGRNNRWHKLHPHLLFPNYKQSLYVDGNINILTSYYSDLIKKTNLNFLLPGHDKHHCIYIELERIVRWGKDKKENIDVLLEKYRKEGMPENLGMSENNIIFRKHNEPEVINLMEQWWHMVENYSKRDQASFMYIMWKNNIDIKPHLFKNARTDFTNCLLMKQNDPINRKTILITGGAGFIGSTLADELLFTQNKVIAVDNFSDNYPPEFKESNIKKGLGSNSYKLYRGDIEDAAFIKSVFAENKIDIVVHIAARSGVRASVQNPPAYVRTNIGGTVNVLEAMKENGVKKIVFASSSSVYGNCKEKKFSEKLNVSRPISPYAATKIACEQMLYTYTKLFGMQAICLRFFTVYGPRQRPDLAIRKFIELIREDRPIPVYGDGTTVRDYTYIGDIIFGIMQALLFKGSNYSIINLGGGSPISLNDMIKTIEKVLGKKANIDRKPMQPGDVDRTAADISKARRMLGYEPTTSFEEGIRKYLEWSDAANKQ